MNQLQQLGIGMIVTGILVGGVGLYKLASSDTYTSGTYTENLYNPPPIQQPRQQVAGVSNSAQPVSKVITTSNKETYVFASRKWHDTGVDIAEGQSVSVDYRMGHWTDDRKGNSVDGEGRKFEKRYLLLVPSSTLAALVGKVGENTFHVGNSYYGSPGSGRLYLSINDIPDSFDNNVGTLVVVVNVR